MLDVYLKGVSAMITGVGLDLCEISRIAEMKSRERFLARFFTEAEQAYILGKGKGADQTLAGMFAAKEAFGKALGGGIDFEMTEVEILHDGHGRPCYALHGETAKRAGGDRFHLSVSHEGNMAAAVCVREDFLAKTDEKQYNDGN